MRIIKNIPEILNCRDYHASPRIISKYYVHLRPLVCATSCRHKIYTDSSPMSDRHCHQTVADVADVDRKMVVCVADAAAVAVAAVELVTEPVD